MTEVRPFQEEFAGDVAALYFRAMRGQWRPAGKALPDYFCEMLLRNPWAAAAIPSLVAIDQGKVIAALGIIPRPMEFRGRNIVAATMTQFMVDPDHRRSSAGVQLLRRCFEGPQDLTWVDGASDPVWQFHKIFGSLPAYFYSLHWMRVLRPFETGRDFLTRFGTAGRVLHGVAGLVTVPADLVAMRLSYFRAGRSEAVSVRAVSAGELFACIEEIGWRETLRPRYDAASFAWLIGQAGAAAHLGTLRTLIVQDADGVKIGWLVYYAKARGTAYLLQLGTRGSSDFEPVLEALFADARDERCVTVKGPSRPEQLTALTSHHCIFRHPGSSALIHSRDAEIQRTVRLGEAALSGLDGERWHRFSAPHWD